MWEIHGHRLKKVMVSCQWGTEGTWCQFPWPVSTPEVGMVTIMPGHYSMSNWKKAEVQSGRPNRKADTQEMVYGVLSSTAMRIMRIYDDSDCFFFAAN